jgi:hypothetical protein
MSLAPSVVRQPFVPVIEVTNEEAPIDRRDEKSSVPELPKQISVTSLGARNTKRSP